MESFALRATLIMLPTMTSNLSTVDLGALALPFVILLVAGVLLWRAGPESLLHRLSGGLAGLALGAGFAVALGASGWQVAIDASALFVFVAGMAGMIFDLPRRLHDFRPVLYVLFGLALAWVIGSFEDLASLLLIAALGIFMPWQIQSLSRQQASPSIIVLILALTLFVIAWTGGMPNGYRLALAIAGTCLAMAVWNFRQTRFEFGAGTSLALGCGLVVVMIRMFWTGDLPLPALMLLLMVLFSNTLFQLPAHWPVWKKRLGQISMAALPAIIALLVSDLAHHL